MKKRTVTLCLLVVIMVMTFAPMVVHAESISYDGKCTSFFTATKTLTKINDTKLINKCWHACDADWGGGCVYGVHYTSKILIAGTVRSTMYYLQPSMEHEFVDSLKRYTGTCQVQSHRDPSAGAARIHVNGEFTIKP